VEVDRVKAVFEANGCDVLLAVGGGKCIDTGKAVAHEEKVPVVVIPTIASTDAPCSALTVLYTEEHVFDSYYVCQQPKNRMHGCAGHRGDRALAARFLISGMAMGWLPGSRRMPAPMPAPRTCRAATLPKPRWRWPACATTF